MAAGKINVGRSGLWRPTVYPYLEQLASQLDSKSAASVSVDIEGVRILVTPLEQELVLSLLEDEEVAYERKHILVRDGLGLRIKILSELNSLAQESSKKRTKILDTVVQDIGLGFQLMHEITLEMRSIQGKDQIAEAREFSQYRQQLSRTVGEAEKRVANRSEGTEDTDTDVWNNGFAPKVKIDPGNSSPVRTTGPRLKPAQESSPMGWVALALIVIGAGCAVAWFFLLN